MPQKYAILYKTQCFFCQINKSFTCPTKKSYICCGSYGGIIVNMTIVLANKFKRLYVSPKVREFVRFAMVGLIATGIHYGIYYFLNLFINVNVAYTIGYLVSWLANLYLTAHFTFKSTLSFKKGVGFAVSHLVNYILHMLFLNLFLAIGVSEEIAPLFVFALVIPVSFLLVRFVFKFKQFQSQEK